jgi:2,3-dihydroxybiphenyl 1,2-dioxygenase
MELQALGYVGLNARNLEDWAGFGVNFLGMELVEHSRSILSLRMDDRRQRLVIQSGEADRAAFFGSEVADAAALANLAARLEAAGVKLERLPPTLADSRRVNEAIAFADPFGNRLEMFHGPETAPDPFKPGRAISGFRTGPLGMGHVVITVERIEDGLWFYQDLLGFALSDYMLRPFKIYFFHVNPRHHSFAMLETGNNGVHHLMIELYMLDDVGQAYDLALSEEKRIATTLGRHTNDYMTSFYARTPSRFLVEYGWGGRSIDPKSWTPVEIIHGPSLWGHERAWVPADQLAEARTMRARAALEGQRAPVQVIEGNYTLAPGTCQWWDTARKAGGT